MEKKKSLKGSGLNKTQKMSKRNTLRVDKSNKDLNFEDFALPDNQSFE
jgi:hypothetical protein